MAPIIKNKLQKPKSSDGFIKTYVNAKYLNQLLFDPHNITPVCCLLWILELALNIFIIERVNYTEIDWKAYMQEVEGFLNGTFNYSLLKGDTGPLVYPAGFLYVYAALYYITDHGHNIHLAQYIFLILYLSQILLTWRIFKKTAKIPPYAIAIVTLTSYRIHSIYVLRLFNDPVAVFLFYLSLNFFISNQWILGSIFYSLAVSIKMNILLYSPALLIAYLTNLTLSQTIFHLFICGLIQLILGAPFLLNCPLEYIKGSFDLGRVFEHKWTVNYRFLPREVFENRYFHLFLLLIHIVLLLVCVPFFKRFLSSYAKLSIVTNDLRNQLKDERKKRQKEREAMSKKQREFLDSFEKQLKAGASDKEDTLEQLVERDTESKFEQRMSKITQLFVLPFFLSNFIGIICARSLHYQFYCWYFHSLIYLGFCTNFSKPFVFLLLGLIEYCWNVYPSSNLSSCLLHCCHLLLLYGIYKSMRV